MQKNLLIVGAGGVGKVVAHKSAEQLDVFSHIHIASRKIEKCNEIIDSVKRKKAKYVPMTAHAIDALDVDAMAQLIKATNSKIVINVGTAFLNMSVMSACLSAGAAYIDTAIHEDPLKICETPPWYANYEWKRREEFKSKGLTAILGAGFDPGVVNAYAAVCARYLFDKITDIDIVDINAGKHNRWFATNFDPEINFREFTGTVYSWQNNAWQSNKMFEVGKKFDMPVVGPSQAYLSGHDEVHSLSQILKVPNIRFWMGFGEHYINVFTVLKNLGLLSEQPVKLADGQEVVPLKVVKAVLPEPASLAQEYSGKTSIGDFVKGEKDGQAREVLLYNVSDHKQAYLETESQGISYTAGVPPVGAAILVAKGDWDCKQMVNVEELDPRPFINLLNNIGLPTHIRENGKDELLKFDI